MLGDPAWAGLADALESILDGERDRARLLDGRDSLVTVVVTTVLDQLADPRGVRGLAERLSATEPLVEDE
jgi:hypothetical protein